MEFVRGAGGWSREELDEHVDYVAAKGHPVGAVIGLSGVRGPNPLDPPYDLHVTVDAVRAKQAILNGKAYDAGDYYWSDLREDPHRVVLLKVIALGRDVVIIAPMRRLIWERAARAPF